MRISEVLKLLRQKGRPGALPPPDNEGKLATMLRRLGWGNGRRGAWAAGLGLAAGVAAGLFWTGLAGGNDTERDSEPGGLRVQAIQIRTEPLRHRVRLPGNVTFLEKAAVHSKVPGRVARVLADRGSRVRRGTPLAQMETFDLRIRARQSEAAIRSARATLALTRAKYNNARNSVRRQMRGMERQKADIVTARATFVRAQESLRNKKELYDLGGVSRTELKTTYADFVSAMSRYYQSRKDFETATIGFRRSDLRRAGHSTPEDPDRRRRAYVTLNTRVEAGEVQVAEAQLRNARLERETVSMLLREATVRSPLAGVVAARGIEAGEEIKPGEPLFTVVRMDRLVVSVAVSERELQALAPRAAVRVWIEALGDEHFEAKILDIAPVVDARTRSAEVRVELANGKNRVRPGMFARVELTLRKRDGGIAIPPDALRDREDPDATAETRAATVFLIREGLAFERRVTLGESFGERVEVLSGLEPGDQIAVSQVRLLRDGTRVVLEPGNSGSGKQSDPDPGKGKGKRRAGEQATGSGAASRRAAQ